MPVPEPEADRQGNQDRDAECHERELGRLEGLVEQEASVVRHEAERLDEEGGEASADPAPGCEEPLQKREQPVRHQREEDREAARRDELGTEDVGQC